MKKTIITFKDKKNSRDGYDFRSKYWQDWKKKLPELPLFLKEVSIGMILSDATMYKVSKHAFIKFEQGYQQQDFLRYLFDIYKLYCFMDEPGVRFELKGPRKGLPKSFWFKTFSHPSFTEIWNLFYEEDDFNLPSRESEKGIGSHVPSVKQGPCPTVNTKFKKVIKKNLIKDNLTDIGLSFWVMGDGSLQKDGKTMILHTQSYNEFENNLLSSELNAKFNFQTKVIKHKEIYNVIKFNSNDSTILKNIIDKHIYSSMSYKIPKV